MKLAIEIQLLLTLVLRSVQSVFSDELNDEFALEGSPTTELEPQQEGSWDEFEELAKKPGLADNYPLAFTPTDELIEFWGYKAETHYVTTNDGYILAVHRIPSQKSMFRRKSTSKSKYPPVFFQHGLYAASDQWLIRGPQEELAFQLAREGYDVWLNNARGNYYSRNHSRLLANESNFWDFSWHDMGTRDLPAVIDYVLAKTGKPRLFYIGHSMGTTQFYVMASARPEYNDKIVVQFSLAPVCFMGNMKAADVIRPFAQNFDFFKVWIQKYYPLTITEKEFFPRDPTLSEKLYALMVHPIYKHAFWRVLFSLIGPDADLLDKDTVALFLGHMPSGASEQTLKAYAQTLLWKDKFKHFDYGKKENLELYGSEEPPPYNLSAITAKVALYYSHNDYLSHPKDVLKLAAKLPNVLKQVLIDFKKFNHLDYLWGTNPKKYFANDIMDTIRKFS